MQTQGDTDRARAPQAPIDIPATIRRIAVRELRRRAVSQMILGFLLAPLACWFSVSRIRPDLEWAPVEMAVAMPLLAACVALVLYGARLYPRDR